MAAIFPENSTLLFCKVCVHVTTHDTSCEPPTCLVCAIRLISSARDQS